MEDISGNTLLVLAAILFFGLIIPQFFKRFKLSFATSLIILGFIAGPNGLDYVQPDDTMEIFGFLGATFLMLLAGFEAKTLHIKDAGKTLWWLAGMNAILPLVTGTAIAKFFGYSWETALFMGVVFISSSIMMVFANVKDFDLGKTKLGKTLKSLVVLQDLTSSLFIFVLFKYIDPHQRFPLPILLGLLISSVVILRMFLPEVVSYFFERFEKNKDEYESRIRLVLAALFIVLLLYSALDVHPIIAAFLVGFTLSDIPHSAPVKDKLFTIGYSIFIPIYLFVVGVKLDLAILTQPTIANYLIITVVMGLLLSKSVSGFLGGLIAKFARWEAAVIGISSTTKLTVTVSSAYVALTLDLIDSNLYTAIILMTIITTILNPVLMALIIRKHKSVEHG